jgi:gamma-glutamylcyclotransferase (GGCT)/AIG2-like uncharacterized protein YtfP
MNLFVYGTLMVPEVMYAVCGYDQPGVPASIDGFRRRRVSGESYPAIAPSPGNSVNGMLYRNVSATQLEVLDDFEGAMYQRRDLLVQTDDGDIEAAAYVVAEGCHALLSSEEWSLETFTDRHLSDFMADYQGFLALR